MILFIVELVSRRENCRVVDMVTTRNQIASHELAVTSQNAMVRINTSGKYLLNYYVF